VALINGGYGTFDMKKYDANIFESVMQATTDFGIYWKYYICYFVFSAAFFNFMFQLVNGFEGKWNGRIKIVSYVIAGIRGVLDMVENIILLNQIYNLKL